MTGTAWRRAGPWLTPALVVIEIVLVATRLVTLRDAVIVIVVVEVALAVTVTSRVVAAVRRCRSERARGVDGWAAAEDGLALLVPRPLARVLLIEPRLFACLARWVTGRHEGRSPSAFGYHRGTRVLFGAAVALVVIEGLVVDAFLAVLTSGPWVWIALGVHVYAVVWLGGLYASLAVRPHRLADGALLVRDGVFTELAIPYAAIARARAAHHTNFGRSGLRVDGTTGTATLAFGDATVTVDLTRAIPAGRRNIPVTTLHLTADDPRAFATALTTALHAHGDAATPR